MPPLTNGLSCRAHIRRERTGIEELDVGVSGAKTAQLARQHDVRDRQTLERVGGPKGDGHGLPGIRHHLPGEGCGSGRRADKERSAGDRARRAIREPINANAVESEVQVQPAANIDVERRVTLTAQLGGLNVRAYQHQVVGQCDEFL
jgi:hypothetical protein